MSRLDILTRQQVGDKPVGAEASEIKLALDREVIPVVKELRTKTNAFLERPSLPIFTTAPVTDTDFDPNGDRPPEDGVAAIGSDGKLYVRVNGAYLAFSPDP